MAAWPAGKSCNILTVRVQIWVKQGFWKKLGRGDHMKQKTGKTKTWQAGGLGRTEGKGGGGRLEVKINLNKEKIN